jgi:hypothetical protein
VRKLDSNGKFTGWSLSSTHQTRDAVFNQLVKQARVSLSVRVGGKGRRA